MNTPEIDRQRGAEVRWLGALVLPVTQAIDDQLDGGSITHDKLDHLRCAEIIRLIQSVHIALDTWQETLLPELRSKYFIVSYSHPVASALDGMVNEADSLSDFEYSCTAYDSHFEYQRACTLMIGHYREYVRRVGLLLSVVNGIFDQDTVSPDWLRSLPASVPVFDCNTQTMQQVASKELLIESGLRSPIWEPSAIVFQPQKVQWERVKLV